MISWAVRHYSRSASLYIIGQSSLKLLPSFSGKTILWESQATTMLRWHTLKVLGITWLTKIWPLAHPMVCSTNFIVCWNWPGCSCRSCQRRYHHRGLWPSQSRWKRRRLLRCLYQLLNSCLSQETVIHNISCSEKYLTKMLECGWNSHKFHEVFAVMYYRIRGGAVDYEIMKARCYSQTVTKFGIEAET